MSHQPKPAIKTTAGPGASEAEKSQHPAANQSRRSPPAFTGESGRPARHGLDHSELLSHRDAAAVLTVQIKPKGIFFPPAPHKNVMHRNM